MLGIRKKVLSRTLLFWYGFYHKERALRGVRQKEDRLGLAKW